MKCPKCGAPLQEVDLGGGASVTSCVGCGGVFYPSNELAVEIALSNVRETKMICPGCGQRLRTGTMFEGKLELDQCESCAGVWFDPGEINQLRSLSGVEGLIKNSVDPAPPPKETRGAAAETSDDEPAKPGHLPKLPNSGTASNADASNAPTVTLNGITYKHYQTSIAQVTCALGEFHWKVAVGEEALARDFISPPFLLSNERTGKDSVWTQGRYSEGSEVWKAFGLEGGPPHQTKIAPAQPNPWQEAYAGMGSFFWIAGIVAVCLGMFAHINAADKTVIKLPFAYDRAEAEKSKVSPEFTLDGRTSNVEVVTDTNLNQHWAYITMALINSETDEAQDFGREISFYSGSDSDGPWSEGAPYDIAVVPNVPAGRYYLRVEPEDGDAQNFNYQITIRRDVPQWAPLLVGLALLLLPFVLVYWRRYAFEVSRWQDSDHPWVAQTGGDSDDD